MKTITTSNTIPATLELILRPACHSLYNARWAIRRISSRIRRTIRADIRRIRNQPSFSIRSRTAWRI